MDPRVGKVAAIFDGQDRLHHARGMAKAEPAAASRLAGSAVSIGASRVTVGSTSWPFAADAKRLDDAQRRRRLQACRTPRGQGHRR